MQSRRCACQQSAEDARASARGSCTPTRATTTHAVDERCGRGASFHGLRGVGSNRASDSGGIAGWSSGRCRGSTASAALRGYSDTRFWPHEFRPETGFPNNP